jgi:hypothetical protein
MWHYMYKIIRAFTEHKIVKCQRVFDNDNWPRFRVYRYQSLVRIPEIFQRFLNSKSWPGNRFFMRMTSHLTAFFVCCVFCATGSPSSVFVNMFKVFVFGIFSFTNTTRIFNNNRQNLQSVFIVSLAMSVPNFSRFQTVLLNLFISIHVFWKILNLGYLWLTIKKVFHRV